MPSPDHKRLLGQFVRAHRERLSAEAAGRRRTPGLRREELAARAGISATWCAFIEQGRDVQISPQALARLAAALSLTPAERAYLFELAGRRDPDPARPDPEAAAPPSLARAVEALAHPAYGLDPLWSACCWNQPARRLFAGWLDSPGEKNLLRFVFSNAASQRLIPDWEDRARRLVAEFRIDYSVGATAPRLRALVEELRTASPDFAKLWDAQEVLAREGGLRRFNHPTQGPLAFEQHTLVPIERPDYKMIFLTPA